MAPAGRLEGVLTLRIRDGRIHRIDIIGDKRRLDTVKVTLPR